MKMVKILKSATYSLSYPHGLAKIDAQVTRVCNGHYETKLKLLSIHGHVDEMKINTQNVKDAMLGVVNVAQLSVSTMPKPIQAPPRSVIQAPDLAPSP